MHKRRLSAIAAVCAAALAVSACGSSDDDADTAAPSGTGGATSAADGNGAGVTKKISLITDTSGPNNVSYAASVGALKARFSAYATENRKCSGVTFDVAVADAASTATGAVAAAQKAVLQDKPFAVVEDTSNFNAAATYATTVGKDIPFVGGAFDYAPQWSSTDNNLFPASGEVPSLTATFDTTGNYLKAQGVTKPSGISYDALASKKGLEASIASVKAAGLETVYTNTSLQFGGTDVGAAVLGVKNSGADAVLLTVLPDTVFAILAGLRQAGVNPKVVISPTGYGNALLSSAPAVAAGQGVTFQSASAPVESGRPAAKLLSESIVKYAGSQPIPTLPQSNGWLGGDLVIHGLELAGCDATQTEWMTAVRKDKTYDAGGLLPIKHDFMVPTADQQCSFYLTLKGNAFVPVEGASPLCGKKVSG